ncbi:hypothetical protein LZ31DRAFT_237363 [Colletotrichum somersetense]|nr:hypothetical protein LZ31DRAFT_237363 [Colletotrichum somersetense]
MGYLFSFRAFFFILVGHYADSWGYGEKRYEQQDWSREPLPPRNNSYITTGPSDLSTHIPIVCFSMRHKNSPLKTKLPQPCFWFPVGSASVSFILSFRLK